MTLKALTFRVDFLLLSKMGEKPPETNGQLISDHFHFSQVPTHRIIAICHLLGDESV